MLATRIQEIINEMAKTFGGSAQIEYIFRYPGMVNDAAVSKLVHETAASVVGADNISVPEPQMGGEDFAYFLRERPGCFFMVGTRNDERGLIWGHHHPRFDIDEDGMGVGIEVMTRSVIRYLNEGA
jgi:amidohydrolase